MKTISRRISISASAIVILFVCGLLATAIAGLTPEQARELGEIQKAIKAKGARWKAGETSVLRLSREKRKGLCGVLFAEKPEGVPAGDAVETALGERGQMCWDVFSQVHNTVNPFVPIFKVLQEKSFQTLA